MKDRKEHPIFFIHGLIWLLLVLTFDFLTKRNEFAVWDNDYFGLIYIIFIGFLICEIWNLKQIGFKNHIESLSKKTLNWYIGLEIGLLLITFLMADVPDYLDYLKMPHLLNIELAINLVLVTSFTSFFIYLRRQKNKT
jgi:hypothetical protein